MKSQAFSMDIMLAFVIFIGTIFIFYSVISGNENVKIDDLKSEASTVLTNLGSEDSDLGILDGVNVDDAKLQELLGENYIELKKKLRVKNEFCLYFEDEDGNVIYIEDSINPTNTYPGIGSGEVIFTGGEGCSPECNDGIDNDGVGGIDLADGDCSGLLDDSE